MNGSPQLASLSLPNDTISVTRNHDLPSIASSANETLANVMMPIDPEISNDLNTVHLFNNLTNSNVLSNNSEPRTKIGAWKPPEQNVPDLDETQEGSPDLATRRDPPSHRPIAIDPNTHTDTFMAEFGGQVTAQKPKARGRFTPDRRKQVQQVRRKGACVRCRMLKKPCSDRTPCSTCKSVDGPRLWKQPCVRTRLVEGFGLWSAGLHAVLASQAVNAAKSSCNFECSADRLEASHYPGSSTISLSILREQHGLASGRLTDTTILLDNVSDDPTQRIEQYMRVMIPTFYKYEKSNFLSSTLHLSKTLAEIKSDDLLSKALELRVAVQILTSQEWEWNLKLKEPGEVTANSTTASTAQRASINFPATMTPSTHPKAHHILIPQLACVVEKRTSTLSKTIMNELERRLIQRTQHGSFELFLVAVILLNCVERSCWHVLTWDVRSEEAVRLWLENVNITLEALERCGRKEFVPGDSRSLDGKYWARLLLPLASQT